MPREHASALCKVYSDNLEKIIKVLKNESLQIGQLIDVDLSKGNDGDYIMKINYTNTPKNLEENEFSLTKEQIQLLISGMFMFIINLTFDIYMTYLAINYLELFLIIFL